MIEQAFASFRCVLQTQFTVPLQTVRLKTEPHSPQMIRLENTLSSFAAVVTLLFLFCIRSATASKASLSMIAGTRSGIKYWSRSPLFSFFLKGSVSVVYFFCTRTSPAYFSLQRIGCHMMHPLSARVCHVTPLPP